LRDAVRYRSDFAQAHHNLGVALFQQGQLEEAFQSLQQALQLKPDYADACYNLGIVLDARGQRAEAVAYYRQALRLEPERAEVYNNLGLALTEVDQAAEALVLLRQAIRLRPQLTEAHNNLGLALAELGRFAEAEASYQEALRLDPQYVEAHSNLGNAYKEQGRLEEALASYQVALWLQPEAASTHWNRSHALLQMGDFEQGWPEYEWRWKRPKAKPRQFPQPRWDGSALAGRTILLHTEQGLGDMLMFIRYAPLVQQRGGSVVVECPGSLVPLFSRCRGIDRLVARGASLPGFNVHAPLMSLPYLLGTTLATIPAEVPYLYAEEERVESWRHHLSSLDGFKIGIVWQGNPHYRDDRYRSVPLARFAPLARLPGVRLISLQKGPGTEQLGTLAGRFPVTELTVEQDSDSGAFLDTAAIMRQLDLVITVDTAPAHLAGGLGVPVWVALPGAADWRWLRDREDSPWYPTMRLFRQNQLGHWPPVFERMADEIEKLLPPAAQSPRQKNGSRLPATWKNN
jgi:Flp pilus assembly protein TadD